MSDFIQERIDLIKEGHNPYFIAELQSGFIVLGDHQRFPGYTLFLCKHNATELHKLDNSTRLLFLEEMALTAECVWQAFTPEKLNYELLGNGYPHMHWHIFPRRESDAVKGPVWWLPYEEMQTVLPNEEMSMLKEKLIRAVENHPGIQAHVIAITSEHGFSGKIE